MAGGAKIAPAEASETEYSLAQPTQEGFSGDRRIGLAFLVLGTLVLLLGPQQMWHDRTAALIAEPVPVIDLKKRSQGEAEMAYVIVIRHGEKPRKHEPDSNGLSATGVKRSLYLAECMSSTQSSLALPSGAPKYLLASHTKPDKSHRAIDTATPLANRLGLKVHDDIHVSTFWLARAGSPPATLSTAPLTTAAPATPHLALTTTVPPPFHPRRTRTTKPSCRRCIRF
jgi:hypothetical protein